MTSATSDAELAALIADLRIDQPAAAEPRCTVTELPTRQCAHCRPAQPTAERPRLGPWIAAQHKGSCAGCGSEFDVFDMIRAGQGGWLGECCGGRRDEQGQQDLVAGLVPPAATGYVSPRDCLCPGNEDGTGHAYGCKHWATQMTAPTGPPPSTVAEMREVLANLDANRPRSRQTTLGPSELGTPCQRQIAMKLAGIVRQPEDKRPPWAPMQGTAIHGLMEEALRFHNAQLGRQRWIVEERLTIHPGIPGTDPGIHGHGDAFDTDYATVVDWKYVGVTTLREVKRKTIPNEQLVKPEYRVQAHLYGYGHARAGRDVRYVRLVFLARSHDYADSTEWTEEYRPEIAIWAIDRYYATQDLIGPNGLDLANNPSLWPAVPAAPGKACSWCPFRRIGGPADATGCPGNTDQKIDKQLHGLIA